MKWRCPVCKKEFENFSIRDFAMCPKTTLYGDFKIRDMNGNIEHVDSKINKPVCSEECKQKNENQYFVEEYKGNKIYCVDGKYMPYLDCEYWYDSIEGVKNRIDNPQLIPVTPTLIRGLGAVIR
jgi:hypothetical protein